MSDQSLAALIASGEDGAVEFKSAAFRNESLAKEIVAFSNMAGGRIFIGIEDDGTISGAPAEGLEERVINVCRNLIEPSVIPELYAHRADNGARVWEIRIPRGVFRPYQLKQNRRFYVRVGSVSIEPSTQELVRLLQAGGLYHFEITALPGTGLNDLDLLRLRLYCERQRQIEFDLAEIPQLLTNWQLSDALGQCTIAGLLFFGLHPARLLPQAGIQLFRFAGTDRTGDILDQRDSSDPIPDAIAAAVRFVETHSMVRSVFPETSIHRQDRPDYDLFAVRELVVNAFCHRDWSICGQRIRLSLFDDRLEIFSPGALPNSLSVANALAGVSYYRNPNVAQLCRDYALAEKAGRGLQKIFRQYRDRGMAPPEFVNDPAFFQVTLRRGQAIGGAGASPTFRPSPAAPVGTPAAANDRSSPPGAPDP